MPSPFCSIQQIPHFTLFLGFSLNFYISDHTVSLNRYYLRNWIDQICYFFSIKNWNSVHITDILKGFLHRKRVTIAICFSIFFFSFIFNFIIVVYLGLIMLVCAFSLTPTTTSMNDNEDTDHYPRYCMTLTWPLVKVISH